MRELTLTISKRKQAPYLNIADAIREAIRTGQVRPGESLPSTRALGISVRAHRHTVMSALDELVAEGWLVARQRSAYQVVDTLPAGFFEVKKPASIGQKDTHCFKFARDLKLPPLVSLSEMKFNFKSGIPDLRLFPHQEFKSCLSDSIKRGGANLMEYGDVEGHRPFIAELKTYLRRVRAISDREIIVTHGSQEAIFLIGQLLLAPGDRVAVEQLGYPPAFGALRATGAELVPIRMDREGLDPDHLEACLRKGKVRLIYVTPLHQYPTTVTLPLSRRLKLYELAVKYRVPILEDDYDHEYHYRCQPIAPLAADDPAGLILYVSTFSKVFNPSARLGFMAVPKTLVSPISNLKRIVSRQNDLLLQDALARWMKSSGFERHLRRTRRSYEERRDTLIKCVEAAKATGVDLSWEVPDGGMAVWVKTSRDSAKIAEKARSLGIYVGHEAEFQVEESKGRGIRLGFARQKPEEISRGMELFIKSVMA